MRMHHGAQVEVHGQAAADEVDIVLLDVPYVALDGEQRVDDADIVPLARALAAEGRQKAQSAALAAHVPLLAAADVVEQRLVVLLHDDAHVAHAGVLQRGERKVYEPIASRKGQRRRGAARDQLVEPGLSAVRKNQSVKIDHQSPPPSPAGTLS